MSIDAVSSIPMTPLPADSKGSSSSDWDFSFHNLLDIINPLEHLPVIGTLYRAITGTHIGIPEKIAGDALYGGLWGAISSVADAAFEAVTGKDFGDTVLALFRPAHPPQLAQVAVTPAAQLSASPMTRSPMVVAPDNAAINALQSSLSRQGVDSDLAQRAIAAYRRSVTLPTLLPQVTLVPQPAS